MCQAPCIYHFIYSAQYRKEVDMSNLMDKETETPKGRVTCHRVHSLDS